MATSQTFTNTFVNGMLTDIDPHEQPNSSYRYAIGGRLSHNRTDNVNKSLDENVKDGKTRAFTNAKGNSFSFSLCEGYQPIGSIETTKGAVIFSTNKTNSEIGFLTVNDNVYKEGYAVYTTLFNDRNDPNGDLLNFNIDKYIHGFNVYENEFIDRVYWVDGYNQKRVINLPLFYKADGTTYHNQVDSCTSGSTYPKSLSVHAFDERMDLIFPKMKFWKRIPGKLKSGQYQLVCKYISKTGHSSVWSHLTRPVFVTTERLDGDITVGATTYNNAYKTNHHNRTMNISNVMTEEGQKWIIDGIDTRWDQIAIGYVYHESSKAFQEATQYKIYDITSPVLLVDLIGHTGIGITQDELNQRFETQLEVETTTQQEGRTWDANIRTLPDLAIDLSSVTISPKIKYFRADNTLEPPFSAVFNPVTGRNDNDPITNTFTYDEEFVINNFGDNKEVYNCVDDYTNYKGQLFNHLYKGYFRGETQPFGLLFIDRKGNPLFVQHITDYTFPQQYDTKDAQGNPTDWTLTRQANDGQFDLKAMGAVFSNIVIPKNLLYDKFGKLNISGFKIVRTERIRRVANQGMLINCYTTSNGKTDTDNDRFVQPTLWYSNEYRPEYANGSVPNGHNYSGALGSNYKKKQDNDGQEDGLSAAHYFNYHSPDILIEQALPEGYLSGEMQHIGFAHKAYSEKKAITGDRKNHAYTKSYRSLPLSWPKYLTLLNYGRPKIGDKSRIKFAFLHTKGKFGIYSKAEFDPEASDIYDYRADTWATLFWNSAFQDGSVNPDEIINPASPFSSTQQPYSVIMKLQDFESVDAIEDSNSKSTYRTANMLVTPPNYYTGADESSLETRRYFSTGHYQPITQAILDQAEKQVDGQGNLTAYVFSGVEIWGGDCYVNLFDYVRLYPEYMDCSKFNGKYPNYSLSHIIPNESRYNLALLYGRRFAANCVYPQDVACDNGAIQLSNGINSEQTESWSYNEVLLLEENTKFYFPKPSTIKIVDYQPNIIRFSPKKIDGELEDSFRQKLTSDYGFATGEFGAIQRLIPAFNYIYIIQEKGTFSLLTQADRAIATDAGALQISSGAVFGGVRPVSKIYGTQHKNSAWVFNDNFGFFDARMGKIVIFSQAGIQSASDTNSISDPVVEKSIYFDRNISHQEGQFIDVISALDTENNEVLTSFIYEGQQNSNPVNDYNREDELSSFSLIFNKDAGNFHGYSYDIAPFYFNIRRFLLTSSPKSGLHHEIFLANHGLYGNYYREFKETILEYIVNPAPNFRKTFDSIWLNVNYEGWERISKILFQAQDNIHEVILTELEAANIVHNDYRYKWSGSLLSGPSNEFDPLMEKERLKSTYLKVRITVNNSLQLIDGKNTQVSFTSSDFKFRINSPNQY